MVRTSHPCQRTNAPQGIPIIMSEMKKYLIVFAIPILLGGCSILDRFSSGERRIPVSKFAEREFKSEEKKLNKIRTVYENSRQDVLTYVVGFDGTNNSADCDLVIGTKLKFWDSITNKPSCTTVRRLKEQITEIPFGESVAPRRVRYYDGPGAFAGRFTNPFDSAIGYSSTSISDRAVEEFLKDTRTLPSGITEIRLAVIGFSRGAAIARDFVNQVHQRWSRSGSANKVEVWSTLMLYDTVATFQQDRLKLEINPRTEQVVHLLSKNESRVEFRPILDVPVGSAAAFNRLIVMLMPGAHSDVGAGYRFGASVFSDYMAHLIAQEMGLIEIVRENYFMQPLYGLVDSRGWRDKFSKTPSGYACGFKREPQRVLDMKFSESEYREYIARLQSRGGLNFKEKSASRELRFNEPIVIHAESDKTEWDVAPIDARGVPNMGTRTALAEDAEGNFSLKFLDGWNKDVQLQIPTEVLSEIQRHDGQQVQLEVTGLTAISTGEPAPGIWLFVNGCLPTDGIVHE